MKTLKIKKPNFEKKSFKFDKARIVFWISIIGILLFNVILYQNYVRLDLTENKVYSLSDETKQIIDNVDGTVKIEVYFSDNLPVNLNIVKQNTLDLIEEYQQYGNGKVEVEIVNPEDTDFEKRALERGVQQVQFSDLSEDRYEVAQGFIGLAVVYGEEFEALPVVATIDDLEYRISSAIVKLTGSIKPTVSFLTGHGENTPDNNYGSISELLSSQYQVKTLDLTKTDIINIDEHPLIIIASPRENLSTMHRYKIDQYMLNGGKILVLADVYDFQGQTPLLVKNATNFYEFLGNYGATIEEEVILDESYTPITSGFDQIAYPFWALVTGDNINKGIPVFANLEGITLMWANSITNNSEKDEITFDNILTSTGGAWSVTGESINIDLQEFIPSDQKKFTLASHISGNMESNFKKESLPEAVKDKSKFIDQGEVNLIVVADANFIEDTLINVNNQSTIFFLNLVEWFSGTEELSEIRAKAIKIRPLEPLTTTERNIVKGVVIVSIPTIVAIVAGIYLYRRKRKPSII